MTELVRVEFIGFHGKIRFSMRLDVVPNDEYRELTRYQKDRAMAMACRFRECQCGEGSRLVRELQDVALPPKGETLHLRGNYHQS
jgi:hypothetical protein